MSGKKQHRVVSWKSSGERKYPGEGNDQHMEGLELTCGFSSVKVAVTLAGSGVMVIGVGGQKPGRSRLKSVERQIGVKTEKREGGSSWWRSEVGSCFVSVPDYGEFHLDVK